MEVLSHLSPRLKPRGLRRRKPGVQLNLDQFGGRDLGRGGHEGCFLDSTTKFDM